MFGRERKELEDNIVPVVASLYQTRSNDMTKLTHTHLESTLPHLAIID